MRNIIKKFQQFGNVKNLPRSGRPKKLSSRDAANIIRNVKKNQTASAVQIAEKISVTNGSSISASTVRRALHKRGLHGRTARK